MNLVSIPANPVPEGAVEGTLKTRDGVALRFARWPPPPGRKGTVCLFQGRAEFIEKYFETVRDLRARGFAVATLDWRGQGCRSARCATAQGLCAQLRRNIRSTSKPSSTRSCCRIVRRRISRSPIPWARPFSCAPPMRGHRWFDRMVLLAPMIALPGMRRCGRPACWCRALRFMGLGAHVRAGRRCIRAEAAAVHRQSAHLRSGALCPQRRGARGRAALATGWPTVAWADAHSASWPSCSQPSYPGRIRQPMLVIAAGLDAIVSTPAIDEFAVRLRAGSHLIVPGARHELLMEQDRFRGQVLAAFDARSLPGTPLFG